MPEAISNNQTFSPRLLDRVLSTVTELLIQAGAKKAARVVATAEAEVRHVATYGSLNGPEIDRWQIYFGIPAQAYFLLEHPQEINNIEQNINDVEQNINAALSDLFRRYPYDNISCTIVAALEPENDDWRILAQRRLEGYDISNQGRVRSDNIAAISHEGLLFRSKPETMFYDALKTRKIPFAPLPTVFAGQKLPGGRWRLEPDFTIFWKGGTTVVEIDHRAFHTETPAEADERLRCLTNQGVRVIRLDSRECDTPEKARAAATKVINIVEQNSR